MIRRVGNPECFAAGPVAQQCDAALRTENKQSGGKRVGGHGVRRNHGDARHACDGLAGAAVHDVGVAESVNLDEALVIAGCGDRLAIVHEELADQRIGLKGITHTGAPTAAFRCGLAECAQVTAEVDQQVGVSCGFEALPCHVHCVALGNRA